MPNNNSKKGNTSLHGGLLDSILDRINQNKSYKLELIKSSGYIQYK